MKKLLYIVLIIFCSCVNKINQNNTLDKDFDVFFKKFASDSIFQKKHMDFPVIEFYSDEDFPLDIMERTIDEETFVFEDFTKDNVANKKVKDAYEIILKKKKDSVFYQRKGINNYIDVTYCFFFQNNSWYLIEVKDMTD